jgi:phospholipase/carboxylesterase
MPISTPRALVALSGVMVDPLTLPEQIKNRAPVLLGHGEDDPVVPAQFSRDAEGYLRKNNVPVECIIVPGLRHGIDERILTPATLFLQKAFA